MVNGRWSLILLLLVAAAGAAHAQSAEAEAAFRDGKRLMGEKKYAEACDAFAASQRLAPGTSTKLNLADCREKNGELATAWGLFLEVGIDLKTDASNASLAKVAKERAAKLEPRLSYLTVSVPDESRVEGLVITRNGAEIDSGLWNRAIPIDGGSYAISASAPAHEAWTTTIDIAPEGASVTVDVPKFKAITVITKELEPEHEADVVAAPAPASFTGRRKLGIGIGAAGLVGLGLGVVLGLQASGFDQDASDLCPTLTGCAAAEEANALVDKARQRALFANVSYAVGGAAVIAAAVLWFTGAPEHPAVTPLVTASSVGLDVAGRF